MGKLSTMVWYSAVCCKQRASHFGPLGPPRVLRTGRNTSGGHLAVALCAVTVHARRMGHNGLHAGGMHWRGYNVPVGQIQGGFGGPRLNRIFSNNFGDLKKGGRNSIRH
jgi:hypothetical protein